MLEAQVQHGWYVIEYVFPIVKIHHLQMIGVLIVDPRYSD